MKLTPVVTENRDVQLNGEVGRISADGSLGDLLSSGSFGQQLQDKIRASILSAIHKCTSLHAALPEAVSAVAKIESADFVSSAADRMQFDVIATVALPFDQVRALVDHK